MSFIHPDNFTNKNDSEHLELKPFVHPDKLKDKKYNETMPDLKRKRDLSVLVKENGKIKNIINVLYEQATADRVKPPVITTCRVNNKYFSQILYLGQC